LLPVSAVNGVFGGKGRDGDVMATGGRRSDRVSVGFDPDVLDRALPETNLNSHILTGFQERAVFATGGVGRGVVW
jgi:hypothetical protein